MPATRPIRQIASHAADIPKPRPKPRKVKGDAYNRGETGYHGRHDDDLSGESWRHRMKGKEFDPAEHKSYQRQAAGRFLAGPVSIGALSAASIPLDNWANRHGTRRLRQQTQELRNKPVGKAWSPKMPKHVPRPPRGAYKPEDPFIRHAGKPDKEGVYRVHTMNERPPREPLRGRVRGAADRLSRNPNALLGIAGGTAVGGVGSRATSPGTREGGTSRRVGSTRAHSGPTGSASARPEPESASGWPRPGSPRPSTSARSAPALPQRRARGGDRAGELRRRQLQDARARAGDRTEVLPLQRERQRCPGLRDGPADPGRPEAWDPPHGPGPASGPTDRPAGPGSRPRSVPRSPPSPGPSSWATPSRSGAPTTGLSPSRSRSGRPGGESVPYKSARQRRFMHAQHPGIARRWDKEERMSNRTSDSGPVVATAGASATSPRCPALARCTRPTTRGRSPTTSRPGPPALPRGAAAAHMPKAAISSATAATAAPPGEGRKYANKGFRYAWRPTKVARLLRANPSYGRYLAGAGLIGGGAASRCRGRASPREDQGLPPPAARGRRQGRGLEEHHRAPAPGPGRTPDQEAGQGSRRVGASRSRRRHGRGPEERGRGAARPASPAARQHPGRPRARVKQGLRHAGKASSGARPGRSSLAAAG